MKLSFSSAAVSITPSVSEDWPQAQNALVAWLLATCPDPKLRDGEAAVKAATKACDLSEWKDWEPMDTLACALAEAGKFEQAINRIEQTIKLATDIDGSTKKVLADRLQLFRDKKAYHEKQ